MANFQYQEVNLHYEVYGSGFPVLLFAPGGMRSAIDFWQHGPWNPIEALQRHFRVIAMDQRNAGTSRAPITAKDNWESYSTDHLRLLDHLRVDRCHLVGGCIGGAFSFSLMRHAPERVAAAVIQQSIGLDQNQSAFYDMFDGWAVDQKQQDPMVTDSTLAAFRSNLYDEDFVFSASKAEVARCENPLLVLMGQDLYHPESVSRDIAALAPNAELVTAWKEDGQATAQRVRQFLMAHTKA
jgi:pimeloyl-ACP methyl ester carboxylesterase